ncbi:TolC family protein [Prolixibacter denitrificans]|uniref:Outer membrane protein TolC n=2 Tax=Prolixibacter denitrificans TaxID=1541063 RepID=A0A2P8C5I7_9BACT|nr:TolC family protein [Prolixibacter denitrificans]PSK80224.1 outer membrane protein TolC [Prolixibacter denitrificans]
MINRISIFSHRFRFIVIFMLFLSIQGIAQQQDTTITLETAVEIGVKNNLAILAAEKDVAATKGKAIAGLGIKDPEVTGEWDEIPKGSGVSNYNVRNITISQSIDFPTNYIHRKKRGDLDIERSQVMLRERKLELRTQIEKVYYQLVGSREQVNIIRENISLAENFLDAAQKRYNAGKAPILEVKRAQIVLSNIENELAVAQSNYESNQADLNALLAFPDGKNAVPADSLTYRLLNFNLNDLLQQAIETHPLLLINKLTTNIADKNVSLAKGSYLPKITGGYTVQKIGGNNFRGVEAGISIPLWAPFNQRGQVMESKGNLAATKYRSQNAILVRKAMVKGAYNKVIAAQEQVNKYLSNLLQQSEELYKLTLRSYEEGKVGYLNVLDAQKSYIDINKSYINALANFKIQVAHLEFETNQNFVQ